VSSIFMVLPFSELSLVGLDYLVDYRGVMVLERGGAAFWQIFLNRNGSLANIVYHRRNTDTAAFQQISSGRGLSIMTYLNVSL